SFNIFNAASGLADGLGATFSVSGSPDFINSGLGGFGGAGAGQTGATATITVNTQQGGQQTEVITIHRDGSNASGYDAAMPDITLTVKANVIAGSFPTISVSDEDQLNAAIAEISEGGQNAASNTNYTIVLAPASGDTIALTSDIAAI